MRGMHRKDLSNTVRELALILAAAAPMILAWLVVWRGLPADQPLWTALDGWEFLLLLACLLPPVWTIRRLSRPGRGADEAASGERLD